MFIVIVAGRPPHVRNYHVQKPVEVDITNRYSPANITFAKPDLARDVYVMIAGSYKERVLILSCDIGALFDPGPRRRYVGYDYVVSCAQLLKLRPLVHSTLNKSGCLKRFRY